MTETLKNAMQYANVQVTDFPKGKLTPSFSSAISHGISSYWSVVQNEYLTYGETVYFTNPDAIGKELTQEMIDECVNSGSFIKACSVENYPEKYMVCPLCGCVNRSSNSFLVNSCMDDCFLICHHCGLEISEKTSAFASYIAPDNLTGDFYTKDHMVRYLTMNHNEEEMEIYVLESWADEYEVCPRCGYTFHQNNMQDSPRSGEHMCHHCVREEVGLSSNQDPNVHAYSYKPTPVFYDELPDIPRDYPITTTPYLGVELEIDDGFQCHDCTTELLQNAHPQKQGKNLFYFKHDGSLHERGFELVTHPCSLFYHLNYFPWNDISRIARKYDYKSHSTDTCGLHIHVSRSALGETKREQDLVISRIVFLMLLYQEPLFTFSRRKKSEMCWCDWNSVKFYPSDSEERICAKVISSQSDCHDDRYVALNMQNKNTIEFRLFKGSLNPDTIRSTILMVHNLCQFAKDHTLYECMNTSFHSFVLWGNEQCVPEQAKMLEEYLASRNLPDLSIKFQSNVVKEKGEDTDSESSLGDLNHSYKVGDRVRIRRNLEKLSDEFDDMYPDLENFGINDLMRGCEGEVATIHKVRELYLNDPRAVSYLVVMDGELGVNPWSWQSYMMEAI